MPGGIILVGRGARLRGFSERLASVTGLKVHGGNIVVPQFVIADTRVSPSDAVDVLSVLYAVALTDGAECTVVPEPEYEPVEQAYPPEPEPEPEAEPQPEFKTESKPKKGGFLGLGTLGERIVKLLGENDEDDDVLIEDKD